MDLENVFCVIETRHWTSAEEKLLPSKIGQNRFFMATNKIRPEENKTQQHILTEKKNKLPSSYFVPNLSMTAAVDLYKSILDRFMFLSPRFQSILKGRH